MGWASLTRHVSLTVVVQSLSHVQLFETPMDCSILGFLILHNLPELAQIHTHSVGDTTQLSHPLSPLLLPSIFPNIRVFSNESALLILYNLIKRFCLKMEAIRLWMEDKGYS